MGTAREKDASGLELGRRLGSPHFFPLRDLHCLGSKSKSLELGLDCGADASVFDQDLCGIEAPCEFNRLSVKPWKIELLAEDIQQVLTIFDNIPGGADRPVILWTGLGCRVPALQCAEPVMHRGDPRRVVMPDPGLPEHVAAWWRRLLQILGIEGIAAHIALDLIEGLTWLAVGVQDITGPHLMELGRADRHLAVHRCDGRQVQNGPVV